ncbi:unnamed protein product, partial [Phaeothamnion confervicola]
KSGEISNVWASRGPFSLMRPRVEISPTTVITAVDPEAVAKFLCASFGFERREVSPGGAVLVQDEAIVIVILEQAEAAPCSICLCTNDVSDVVKFALASGESAFLKALRNKEKVVLAEIANSTRSLTVLLLDSVAWTSNPLGLLIKRTFSLDALLAEGWEAITDEAVLGSPAEWRCTANGDEHPSTPIDEQLVPASPPSTRQHAGEPMPQPQPPPQPPRQPSIADRPPVFRSLELSVVSDKGVQTRALPNSRQGIPIDSPFFSGEALLMLRTEPLDEAYREIFEGKQRQFEIQVQGRFKQVPQGDLYIAIEITDRMKLGLVTKGMCKVLLGFAQRLNRFLHYSFGNDDNSELPHISFPLVTSVDTLVVTQPGERPPTLGRRFPEEKDAKKRRLGTGGFGSFEVGPCYSFSFHSMYLSMPRWSTSNIAMMRDMDLHAFWGESAMRIGAYVVPSDVGTKPHYQNEIAYIFCMQVRHDPEAPADGEVDLLEAESRRDEVATITIATAAVAEGTRDGCDGGGGAGDGGGGAGVGVGSSSNGSDLPEPHYPVLRAGSGRRRPSSGGGSGNGSVSGLTGSPEDGSDASDDDSEVFADARSRLNSDESIRYFIGTRDGGGCGSGGSRPYAFAKTPLSWIGPGAAEAAADVEEMARVPAYLELYEGGVRRGDGTGHTPGGAAASVAAAAAGVAAAAMAGVVKPRAPSAVYVVVHGGRVLLRRPKDFEQTLPMLMVPPASQFSPRLSSREIARRRFDSVLQLIGTVYRDGNGRLLEQFAAAETAADRYFTFGGGAATGGDADCSVGKVFGGESPASNGGGSGTDGSGGWSRGRRPSLLCKEGLVIRALSEHHWAEELAVLTPQALTLLRGKKVQARFPCGEILAVHLRGGLDSHDPDATVAAGAGTGGSGGGGIYSGGDSNSDVFASTSTSVGGAEPLPGFFTLEVHTVGRVHYILIAGAQRAAAWAAAVQRTTAASGASSASSTGGESPSRSISLPSRRGSGSFGGTGTGSGGAGFSEEPDEYDASAGGGALRPYEQYLMKKSCWKGGSRWVLNCRRMSVGNTAAPWGGDFDGTGAGDQDDDAS